jgi:hypothetical protein
MKIAKAPGAALMGTRGHPSGLTLSPRGSCGKMAGHT